MGVIGSQQPTTTPAVFDVAVRDVAQRVRTSLAEGVRSTALALAANRSAATQMPVDFETFLAEEIR